MDEIVSGQVVCCDRVWEIDIPADVVVIWTCPVCRKSQALTAPVDPRQKRPLPNQESKPL